MTSDEVLKQVQEEWNSRSQVLTGGPVVFDTPQLETNPYFIDMFREETGLPISQGVWYVYGREQLPSGELDSESTICFRIDDETGRFLTLYLM